MLDTAVATTPEGAAGRVWAVTSLEMAELTEPAVALTT